MTCREAEGMVMPYINGELTMEEQERFLNHVIDCEDCSDELEIYYTIQVGLEQLDNGLHRNNDIHELLMEDVNGSLQRIYRRSLFSAVRVLICTVTAACIAAVLMFAW